MALESDGEDGYLASSGPGIQQPEIQEFGEQQEEFVDDSPAVTFKDFAFQPSGNPAFYDTYRTQDASIPDMQGHLPRVDTMRVVQPASVEMPSPDQEVPSFIRKQSAAKAPSWREAADVMVEEDMDPESGGIPQSKRKGKSSYEPEKDRKLISAISTSFAMLTTIMSCTRYHRHFPKRYRIGNQFSGTFHSANRLFERNGRDHRNTFRRETITTWFSRVYHPSYFSQPTRSNE